MFCAALSEATGESRRCRHSPEVIAQRFHKFLAFMMDIRHMRPSRALLFRFSPSAAWFEAVQPQGPSNWPASIAHPSMPCQYLLYSCGSMR